MAIGHIRRSAYRFTDVGAIVARAGKSRILGFRFIGLLKNLKSGKVQNLGFLGFLNFHIFFRKL